MNAIYILFGALDEKGGCLSEEQSKAIFPEIKSILKNQKCLDIKLKYSTIEEAICIFFRKDIHLKNNFSEIQDLSQLLKKVTNNFNGITVFDTNNKLSVLFENNIAEYTVEDIDVLPISQLIFTENESGIYHRGKISKVNIKCNRTYTVDKYQFIEKFTADNGIDLSVTDKTIIDSYIESQISKIQYGWGVQDAITFIASVSYYDEEYTPTIQSLPNPYFEIVFNSKPFKIKNDLLLIDIDFTLTVKGEKRNQKWVNLVLNTFHYFKDPEFNKLVKNSEIDFLHFEFMDKKIYDNAGYTKYRLSIEPITINSNDEITVSYE